MEIARYNSALARRIFLEMVRDVQAGGHIVIASHGNERAVIVSWKTWQAMQPKPKGRKPKTPPAGGEDAK